MDTLKELYKIGNGPSSSHTMGPKKAADTFKARNQKADKFEVELYGSLAATGKGHLTDYVLRQTLGEDKTDVHFMEEIVHEYHPNGMKLKAYKNDKLIDEWLVFSVGGGELRDEFEAREVSKREVYSLKNMREILEYCENKKISFYDYVIENEGSEIIEYGKEIIKLSNEFNANINDLLW